MGFCVYHFAVFSFCMRLQDFLKIHTLFFNLLIKTGFQLLFMAEKKHKPLSWEWDHFKRLKEGTTIKAECNFCHQKLSNHVYRFFNHLVKDVSLFFFVLLLF